MLEIPTLPILRLQAQLDVEAEINGALDARLREAIAYALAGTGYSFMLALQYLSRQFFVDTADTAFALLWASIYGLEANPATAATGFVDVTSTSPTASLAGGEILERADGVQFSVDAASGPFGPTQQATIAITAVEAGAAGNTLTGTTLTFVAPPANIDADTLVLGDIGANGIAGGFEAETPEALQARTLEQIRSPRRGGAEADYIVWAKEVTGVDQVFARGSYAGIGTVLVIISQAWEPELPISATNTPVPSAQLIADVEAVLEVRKPAGLHLVAVQGPALQNLDPYILLDPDTTAIRDAVTRSLALYTTSVEPGTTAYYDDMVAAINRAAGEGHHQLWTDDGGGSFGPNNTPVGDSSLLVPGTITWTAAP